MNKLEKQILREVKKKWKHDIKKIDGKFIEDVIAEYQAATAIAMQFKDSKSEKNQQKHQEAKEKSEEILAKIVNNYSIFKHTWSRYFGPYIHKDLEAGCHLHDEIIWFAAGNFDLKKCAKANGYAFNAYMISCMLNQLKNFRNISRSYKNNPMIKCPICGEMVPNIDRQHLRHKTDLKKYRKLYKDFPLCSYGYVIEPTAGRYLRVINQAYFSGKEESYLKCPITGNQIEKMDDEYLSSVYKGYTRSQFLVDYPLWLEYEKNLDFRKQANYLSVYNFNILLRNGGFPKKTRRRKRTTVGSLNKLNRVYSNFTLKAKKVRVFNPYTQKMVKEITPLMLKKAGVTVQEHLQNYATLWIDKYYPILRVCPFTGRKTHLFKKSDLAKIGVTPMQFYMATCKYPLQKYKVKCSIDGHWVENIWTHLEDKTHSYSTPMTPEEFQKILNNNPTKICVTNNAYVTSESGDTVFIADLFPAETEVFDRLEIEDSLRSVAKDSLDLGIATKIADCHTLDDLFYLICETKKVSITASPSCSKAEIKKKVKSLGYEDFDVDMEKSESGVATIIIPSRATIKNRLEEMGKESGLIKEAVA
jgi:hypothetical protein